MSLQQQIKEIVAAGSASAEDVQPLITELLAALNAGHVRSAEPDSASESGWRVNTWVKQGILLCFKYGTMQEMSVGNFAFFDKHTIPLRPTTLQDNIRIVPGGSAIRTGAYIAPGVICMPPMYINIGAFVDEGTMVDSHALVGTCAQIGKRVHLSAAAQIGGVLEPAGARPVIIEDDVFIGGNCGVYEGVLVRCRTVLSSGVILNASSKVYDLVSDTIHHATGEKPLEIPAGAVVVSGARAIHGDFAHDHGLSLYTPVIIKYRDEQTDVKTALESALR